MNKRGIIKLGAGIFVLLLILVLVFSSLFSSASPKGSYFVGDEIKMDLNKYAPCNLKIKTPSTTIIQSNCDDKFSLKLEEIGDYTIDIKSQNASEKIAFQVYPKQETGTDQDNFTLFNFTTNNTYFVNETLKFDFNGLGNYELIILSPSGQNVSRVASNDVFFFKLSEEGKYLISFERGNGKTFYEFTVIQNNSNQNINPEGFTQGKAEINKPVGWNKAIDTDILNDTDNRSNLIEIPSVTNLTLTKESGESVNYSLVNVDGRDYVQINENVSQDNLNLNYFTESPRIEEKTISDNTKEVVVSSPPDVHYENVLSYTSIPEVLPVGQENFIKIYWKENNTYLDFKAYDKDGNGLLDYIEWTVPHLSNQTFDIILITKAEHLSSDKTFISNIYEQVKALDNIWSETILPGDYVRVTFENNLTSKNDITIYPRAISGNPSIEVYEKDKDNLIANFTSINSNQYNKVLLTNLQEEQDTFDLKVIGGIVQFDYIVDPTFTKRTYSLVDYTNHTMAWGRPQNAFWLNGTNVSAANYTNAAKIDTNYATVCSTGAPGDFELFESFNFTINEPISSINWINITWRGNYTSNGERGNLYLFNQTSQGWINLSVISGAIANYTVNYTTPYQISNLVGANKQLVIYPRGENFDAADCLNTDYAEVLVGFTDNNPQWISNSTNSTITGRYVLHSLNWTDQIGLSGYVFEFDNGTGTFVNNSFVTISGTQGWSNVSKWISTTLGSTIRWRVYTNDSSNQWNSTVIFTYITTNTAPTQSTPVLNSTFGTNFTSENLTVYNKSTSDAEGDSVKNIINWYRNTTSFELLNMPFEGRSNSTFTKDYSGFRSNGTVSGATWISNGGYDGEGAYVFNGINNYINVSNEPNFDFEKTNNFSGCAWIKLSSIAPASQTIFGKLSGSAPYTGWEFNAYDPTGGSDGLQFYLINNFGSNNYISVYVSNVLATQNWYYACFTYNGNGSAAGVKLYLNGVSQTLSVGSDTLSASILNSKPVEIGTRDISSWPLNGTIDDVRIYNRTLSSQQILGLYQNKTNYIFSQENSVGDVWKACITPNDGYSDGIEACSDNLTVLPSIDSIKPYFTTIPSNASLFYANQSLLVNFVGVDETGFGYYSTNDSRFLINQTGFLSNATPMAVGNYEINVSINDTSNNINWTRYKVQVNKSNYDCGVYFNTSSPITYPSNFITYTNCSSAYTLYKNGTSISNVSTINGGAGYYNLTVQRTDTTNYTNTVMSQFFTINKNSENCQVLYNASSPITFPATFLAWANCTSPFVLSRNGTTITNNSVQSLAIGAYNFSFSRNDSTNYSIIFNQSQFIVSSDLVHPYFTTIPANASLFYANQSLLVTFVATDNYAFGYYWVNDTRFLINQTGFLSNATPMAVGNYEINVSINDTSNNINWTRYKVQVNKSQENCQVLYNASSPITFPATFLAWANCTSPFVLSRNGTTITNNSVQSLAIGAYNFSFSRNDSTNYSIIFNQSQFIVNPTPPPNTSQIECEESGTWKSCNQVHFGDTITQVRVNCTGSVVNASFNLTNNPDSYTFFNANATLTNATWWNYDNPDLTINDSGQFLLNATCYGASSQSSNSTNWTVSWGNISVKLISPNSSLNVNENKFFNFTVQVNCTGGECGFVNATLDPANWWNISWLYRTTINISGTGTQLTDFQIAISKNLTDIYNRGDLKSDCSDIRFANTSAIEMPYWIESCNTTGGNSTFWVKVPNIAASGNTIIYMYYKNPSASSVSNGTSTFDFFDSGNNVGSWSVVGTAGQTAAQGLPQPSYYATSVNGNYMYKNISLTANRIVEYNSMSDGLGNLFFLTDSSGNGQHMRLETRAGNNAGIGPASAWGSWSVPSQTCANLATSTWFNFTLVIGATTAQAYIDNVACGGAYTFSNNGGYIGFVGDALGGSYTTWWDNLRVRKYSSITPGYSFGSEENGIKGVIPMNSGIPFYTTNQNPMSYIGTSCLANMKSGNVCNITWQVNATGEIGSKWDFFVFASNTNYTTYFNSTSTSSHINITIGNLPPSIPELNFPANGSSLTSIGEFNWSNSTDPTGDSVFYIMEISNSSNFSTFVYRNASIPERPIITGVTPTGITQEGAYYWRVRSTDLMANSSWSETRVFYYDLYPPNVTLIFPYNLSTNSTSNMLDFIYNVSDLSDIQSCNLIINDSINDTSTNITKNVNLTFTDLFQNSFYSWKINCTDAAGRVGVSETRFFTTSASNNPPVAREIQCEKNGVWYNCSSIGFGDNLTRVRVRCTDLENGVVNATFNLTNIPDGSNYFYNLTTYSSGNYWILNNSNSIINDSGDFNLQATCFDNGGLSNSNSTTWTVPWGSLLISLIDPSSDVSVMRNAFFTFTSRVNCTGGECGNINLTLDPVNWWNDTWSYRKIINITNSGATTLSNFTVYINLSKESEMQINFNDIRFTNGSCGSSSPIPLNYEIENYTSSKADVWIKIPSFVSGSNQICMYYGNPSVGSGQNKTGVWNNNYKMVLHLSEPGIGTRYDSTVNGNNGTPVNYDGNEHINGEVDGADQILTDDYINSTYLQNSVTQYTISAWINTASTSGTIVQDRGSGAGQSITFSIYPPCGGGGCVGASAGVPGIGVDSNGIWIGSYGTSRVDDGNWHYVVGVFNYTSGSITPSNFKVYVDGKYESGSTGSTGSVSSPLTGLSGTKIGYHEAWGGNYFNGNIDEVTIATTAFSDDWVNQSYQIVQNQNNTVSFGAKETRAKGIVSTTIGATPFYTTTQNPLNSSTKSCLANMKQGDSCQVNWSVNATGALDSSWEFFVTGNNINYWNYFNASSDSSRIHITIASQVPPTTPQLYRPLNATAYASVPNLNWTNSTDLNGDKIYYILQVSNVSDFSTIVFANYSIPETANPTNKTPTGITNVGAYYWRVRATDLIGNSSWSETRVFYYDLYGPNITFINQTGEDNRIINSSSWLNRGENLSIFVNATDINVDKVWIIVWQSIIGGAQKVKTFFTYVGGFLWMGKISTDQIWDGLYNYTIYSNDTLGSQTNYSSNFTVLGGNATISLNPSSTNSVGNITAYGHLNLTNTTNLTYYPINLWLDGKLLFLSNLTGEGTYNFYKNFIETSNSEFSQGNFYQTQVQNNENITLSSGMTYGNYTKILDAGAMVSWNNLSWSSQGASCSGVLSYQEGDSNSYSGTRDTYISSGATTTNYGTSPDIVVDGSPYSIRGLIKFDSIIGRAFNQIPENSTINNANLTLQVSDTGDLVNVYEVSENWTEIEATYNNRLTGTAWGSTGCSGSPSRLTTVDSSFTSPSLGSYTINVSNSMKDWVAGNSQNYGWVFDMPTSNGINIRSSDYGVQSERPLLMVDYQAPECTNLIVYVRTSNDKITWTSWQQVSNGGLINDSNTYSRYLQYRVEFTSVNSTLTPVLKDITVNYTAVVTDSNGNYRYNFTNPSQFGNYNISVNTSLKTILMNNSAVLSVQTGVPPNVSLISPAPNQWFSSGNLNLTYNATDLNNNFAFSELIINGAVNQTNATPITNYAYNNFTINFPSGQYNWTVNITDTTAYESTTAQRTFYIDLIDPNVSLIYPGNQTVYTVNQLNLSFNATDNMDSNLTCNVILDGNTIRSGVGAANGNITNVSSGILGSGIHYWNVTCTDNAFRNFTSSTFNFNISDTPPNVTLISPSPNYLNSDGNISFIYNASDNTGFINCSLIINNTYRTWNQSTILNNQNNSFNISGLSEGNQNWTVECFDLSASPNKPSPRNFTVDLYPPTITPSAPPNSGTSTSSKVYFNFTVNDTVDPSLNCNLTINGVVKDTFNASSGNLTTRPISNLTDGLKSWNVTCIDDALHSNTSATWTVNITEYPSVILNTANNTRYNQTSINLTYTPSDNTNLSSCKLYLNGVFNQSNSTSVLNNQQNNFTLNGIAEGIYNWYVNCSDYFGLTNQSQTRIFYADRSPPQINVSYPIGVDVYASNITFNFTLIDNMESNLSCNLTVNSSVVATNFTAANGSITSKTISGITAGYNLWNLTCWDSSGNFNTSNTFNFTKYTNPLVSLTSPGNNTWFNTSNVVLFYFPEDDIGIVNASLIINGVFNRMNSSPIINRDYNNFSITGFSDGAYYWNVNITNPTGLTGIGAERKIYIDSQSPSLILNSPADSSTIATNNVTFNFTILDNLANYISCNFSLDGSQESSGLYTNNSNILKYSIVGDGNHSWQVDCVDNASNFNHSSIVYFTVKAPPNVTLNLPPDNFRTTSSSIVFNYTPLDPIGIPSCSIYLDGILNATRTDILIFTNQTGRLNNFTINGIQEGMHNWSVNCTDSDSNYNMTPSRTFYRDISPPSISLELPDNNSGIDQNNNRVYFNWTAIDALDTVLQCNLTIDGVDRQKNIWVTGNISTSQYVLSSTIGQGEHTWNVTCWDQLKNTNISELRKFNLTYPDFFVNSSDIILNETNPKENQSVQINATVYNLAGADTQNVTVRFYNGDPDVSGIMIGTNIFINLSKSSQTNVTINWLAQIGTSQIFVVVDPPLATNGSFKELNESNNKAGKNFSVGSWEFFYGNVLSLSDAVLANSNESKILDWGGEGFVSGNVYVTDYNSYISWNSLQAIGKTKTNTTSPSDFATIDSILNSTSYSDSVYSTYTNSGTPKEKLNLSSFGRIIQDVPVVNSTNNSNFVTGILWDTSDDTSGGQFDSSDKEDLVFVAPTNKQAVGTYGTYDYEIRVPAKLRSYHVGSSKAAVFYVELS